MAPLLSTQTRYTKAALNTIENGGVGQNPESTNDDEGKEEKASPSEPYLVRHRGRFSLQGREAGPNSHIRNKKAVHVYSDTVTQALNHKSQCFSLMTNAATLTKLFTTLPGAIVTSHSSSSAPRSGISLNFDLSLFFVSSSL